MPEVLRPETDFTVTVSEKNGKQMTYTLAIVDDGLLDLTNFKTPDPWNEFYAREALGIRTWDMYDDVLGAAAGRYSSLFSTGGDETLKPADAKANRFKPVVKFIGIVCKILETLQSLPMLTMGKQRWLTRCYWPEIYSAATKIVVNLSWITTIWNVNVV